MTESDDRAGTDDRAGSRAETHVADGVVQLQVPATRWLVTGHGGGYRDADAAYNLTVPEGFDRTDLAAYADERRARAGFDVPGPTLLTGVDVRHARGARSGPVTVVATAGVSNPAVLPVGGGPEPETDELEAVPEVHDERADGTVNLLVHSDRALSDGALASLLGVVVEAKTATLLAETGFPGTTSDAAAVGSATDGEAEAFAGSATAVGAAARACVREAVRASLVARYDETALPESVADAEYGVATTRRATVFEP